MMKKTTKWMPLVRHKRSQNARVLYTLADDGVAVVDALMGVSFRTVAEDVEDVRTSSSAACAGV